MSYWEITQKIRLKYGELASIQLCHMSAMADVAGMIFGSDKKSKNTSDYDLVDTGSLEGDVAAIKGLLSIG